jgi:uncharacterized protein (DUF1778 family)
MAKSTKTKRARKPVARKTASKKHRFNMEIDTAEKKMIAAAAKSAGMTMSAWMRLVLRAAAKL